MFKFWKKHSVIHLNVTIVKKKLAMNGKLQALSVELIGIVRMISTFIRGRCLQLGEKTLLHRDHQVAFFSWRFVDMDDKTSSHSASNKYITLTFWAVISHGSRMDCSNCNLLCVRTAFR